MLWVNSVATPTVNHLCCSTIPLFLYSTEHFNVNQNTEKKSGLRNEIFPNIEIYYLNVNLQVIPFNNKTNKWCLQGAHKQLLMSSYRLLLSHQSFKMASYPSCLQYASMGNRNSSLTNSLKKKLYLNTTILQMLSIRPASVDCIHD